MKFSHSKRTVWRGVGGTEQGLTNVRKVAVEYAMNECVCRMYVNVRMLLELINARNKRQWAQPWKSVT